jgi:hypothetical protein
MIDGVEKIMIDIFLKKFKVLCILHAGPYK